MPRGLKDENRSADGIHAYRYLRLCDEVRRS